MGKLSNKLDVLGDFGEAVDSGAVGDIRKVIFAVDEQSLHADASGADNVNVILVADEHDFFGFDLSLL